MSSGLHQARALFVLAIGMAVAFLVACTGAEQATPTSAPPAAQPTPTVARPAPTSTATQPAASPTAQPPVAVPSPAGKDWKITASSPNARRGGTLRLGAHGPPAHFDFFASATIANIGSQGGMYDTLLRHDPRDPTVPIVADLAHSWEISPDSRTYTFHLREGVKFHDGSELTSEDVKATYERIIFPREGLVSQRKAFFPAVSEITTPGKYTVEFKLSEARSPETLMAAFASGWNPIVKKSVLDSNNGNLRQVDNHPGTGPFKYVSRNDDQWVLERNPDYWNENVPYVDRIEHNWLIAWTPENTAALLGGVVDWTMWLDPKSGRDIGKQPGLNGIRQHLFNLHTVGLNTERAPLNDARVRRAFMLVIDRQALLEATKDVKGNNFGELFIAGTPFALSTEELVQMKGFRHPTQEDIQEARQLLADAGFPNGAGMRMLEILTRETPDQRILAPAIQAMLKQHLNVNTEIRIVDASAHGEEAVKGNFDILAEGGTSSVVPDPAIYLKDLVGMCGSNFCGSNTSRWNNQEFNSLVLQLEREVDQARRLELGKQIRELLYREVPTIPKDSGETVYWGYWDHLKGLMPAESDFYGYYDLHRWDTVWLER